MDHLLFSPLAHGALAIGVEGQSNAITEAGTTTYYYSNIGAGYTATGGACDPNRNPNCRTPSSILTVTARTTGTLTNTPKMVLWSGSGASATPAIGNTIIGVTNTVAYVSGIATNTTYTFSKMFSDYCSAASTNCGTDGSISISIIADLDGSNTYSTGDEISTFTLYLQSTIDQYSSVAGDTGFASFVAYPGDGKIYITQEDYGLGFPSTLNTNMIGAQRLRFYFQAGGFPSSANGNDYTQSDVYVNGNSEVSFAPWFVSGLVNNQQYCIISAVVDKAGNIGMETELAERTGTKCAIPDQVIGLMSQSGQCFIATAAFGSPLETQVDTLRKFRDAYLMKSKLGRNFVSWYYDHSPAWAAKIKESESLKKVTRTFLWPLVGYSFLSLKWGAVNATLFTATLLLIPLLLLQHFILRRKDVE